MSRKLGFALATGFALTLSGPLFAADMPVKAPMAPPPPALTWSGMYVGVEGGWEQREADWATNCIQGGGPFTCGSALNAIIFPGAPDSTANFNFKNNNWRGAVYNGFMFQPVSAPNWVFGFEWDYGFNKNASTTVAGILGCSTAACTGGALTPFNLSGDSTTVKFGQDYSFRPRVGYLVLPNLQAYVTGGPAVQKVSATETCNGATSPACGFSLTSTTSTNLLGYSVGGGLEWQMVPQLLLRAEYRYNDYGHWNNNFFVGSGIIETYNTVHVKTQYAQIGLSYLWLPGQGIFGK